MPTRFRSRKFITTLAAQLTAIAVLLFPSQEQPVTAAAESITALLVLVLSTLGYVTSEASIDRARRQDP